MKNGFEDIELKQYYKSEGYSLEGIISDIKEERRKNKVKRMRNITEGILNLFTARHNHGEIQNNT